MQRKFLFVILTSIFTLLLSAFTPDVTNEAKAASKKYGASVISNNVKVREKASTKAKVVGTLKKGTKVTVYSKTKSGWSEIRFKKKKAYVQTKSLKFTVDEKNTNEGYLRNTKFLYTYTSLFNNGYYIDYTAKYSKKDNDNNNIWEDTKNWVAAEREKETKDGLYMDGRKVLAYPLKVGKKWESGSFSYTIREVNLTLKTKAGTFKNVVRVDGYYITTLSYYYARGHGLIAIEDQGNSVVKELTNIKK